MRDESGNAFRDILLRMAVKETLLDALLEPFVGEIDAKLIEGIGID
jgi:hypothetical protein